MPCSKYCSCGHRGCAAHNNEREVVDSLCVKCNLSVCGKASVGKLCFKNACGRKTWCVRQNDDGDLEFTFGGQPRLTLTEDGEVDTLTTRELVVTDQILYFGPRDALNTWRMRPHPDRGQGNTPPNALLWELRTSVNPEVWQPVGDPLLWFPPLDPNSFVENPLGPPP